MAEAICEVGEQLVKLRDENDRLRQIIDAKTARIPTMQQALDEEQHLGRR